MRERRACSDYGFECLETFAGTAGQDLDPPIRQVRSPAMNAESIGAPLREPAEADSLDAPGNDPAHGALVPLPGGPGPGSVSHEALLRRLALQT